ncbi:MAG: 8-amino-7-oxononanoate synthase [Candidatus Omnitrophica bacterium]|nr:8-amino-7-oxononanoate synthase [Candidatus Omnitrophota bacterium]
MNMDFLQKELQDIDALGLRRSLKILEGPQGRSVSIDGRQVLNFCSNDYLGLAGDRRIRLAAIRTIEEYGFGSGASRLICGNMGPHEQLEEELAAFKGTESALAYSSGYMANTGIIPALMDRHAAVFSDKLNHASIIDGIILSRARLLRYPHLDMQALEGMLKTCPAGGRKLIVTDTVFSMDGDRAPLKEIVGLGRRYGALVMVDEAHAFGVLGEHGGGLAEELGIVHDVDIQMGTLSKAAGCFGAYVCGTKILREYLINKSRSFIYTTGMPPALAGAARAAVQIIRLDGSLRRRLQANSDHLHERLKAMGFDVMGSTTPIIPILVKDPAAAKAMSLRLLEQGMLVQAIRPPTVPTGTSRLRLTVTAGHDQEDLDRLLAAFRGL